MDPQSAFFWLSWIRILVRNAEPDPEAWKLTKKFKNCFLTKNFNLIFFHGNGNVVIISQISDVPVPVLGSFRKQGQNYSEPLTTLYLLWISTSVVNPDLDPVGSETFSRI
jgi:hypothetical protein